MGRQTGNTCRYPAADHRSGEGHTPTAGQARGTDAVKLSAKWLTALAALALFAVVMVGIQERGAEAATTGQIYLTNKYTNLTTESGPSKADYDPDRAYVGSGTSLYSTVLTGTWDDDENEILDDNIENSIRDDANVVIITVVDPDADVATDSTPLAVATDVPSRATITVPLNNAGSDGPPCLLYTSPSPRD